VWMAFLTAYGGLVDIGGIAPGDFAVITAASSSVGLAAIQICRRQGAVPIAVTGSAAKADALRQHGAAHVVSGTGEAAVAEVMRITGGRGARLAFDPVAGPKVSSLAQMLGPGGMLMVYGNLSGQAEATPFPFMSAVGHGLSMRGYLVFELIRDTGRLARAMAYIAAGVADGGLRPVVARVFGLDEIVAAHRYLESNQQVGKVVVVADKR
jgi:NADPH:quinone reductase-like Zn-dependent oxidoreductase